MKRAMVKEYLVSANLIWTILASGTIIKVYRPRARNREPVLDFIMLVFWFLMRSWLRRTVDIFSSELLFSLLVID